MQLLAYLPKVGGQKQDRSTWSASIPEMWGRAGANAPTGNVNHHGQSKGQYVESGDFPLPQSPEDTTCLR